MKLVQKQLFKGVKEFEIVDNVLNFRMKKGFKEEKLTIDLSILNPEPEVDPPLLHFHSRIKCDPMLSLSIDVPDAKTFNAFVDELKRRAREEYNAFAGLKSGNPASAPGGNSFDEPPEFGDLGEPSSKNKPLNAERIGETIQMLELHLADDDLKDLLDALKALQTEPDNEAHFALLVTAFEALGPRQGAVLTYAPYVGLLLSDDPFGF